MELLVIRHAIAEEREDFASSGRPDSERPLTDKGREKMREVVEGLHAVVPTVDVLASSPYTRARQTAQIVAKGYGIDEIETVEALVPEAPPSRLASWLAPWASAGVVAVVGHEPHLGMLVTWLISGREGAGVELKKGGVCLLRFEGRVQAGGAVLQWLMTPGQLRGLAK